MIKNISVTKLKKKYESNEEFILLDVRTDSEVVKAQIPIDSIHIPMNEIPNRLSELDKNKDIIIHCKIGQRSAKVCEYLLANGFSKIKNLTGGILAWARDVDSKIIVM